LFSTTMDVSVVACYVTETDVVKPAAMVEKMLKLQGIPGGILHSFVQNTALFGFYGAVSATKNCFETVEGCFQADSTDVDCELHLPVL